MRLTSQTEKWLKGVLGIVCLVLVIDLVMQLGGIKVGATRSSPAEAAGAGSLPSSQKEAEELSRYDPTVRLELLKEFQSRPLARVARNPFEFVASKSAAQPVGSTPPPAPPPAPPPVPLKTLGYFEKGEGKQEAFVSDEEQIYVVHEGETFAQKYKVLKINPKFIEIEDESSHQTVQLPFAQ